MSKRSVEESVLMIIARKYQHFSVNYIQQSAVGSPTWQEAWTDTGIPAGFVESCHNQAGLISVFTTYDGIIHQSVQVAAPGLDVKFSAPVSLNVNVGRNWEVVQDPDGYINLFNVNAVFGEGKPGPVQWTRQKSDGSWPAIQDIGGSVIALVPFASTEKTISLFGVDTNANVVRGDFDFQSGSPPTWHPMGGEPIVAPEGSAFGLAAGYDAYDKGYVFACAESGPMFLSSQQDVTGNTWTPWQEMDGGEAPDGPFIKVCVGRGAKGQLVVIGLTDAMLYSNFLRTPAQPGSAESDVWSGWIPVAPASNLLNFAVNADANGRIWIVTSCNDDQTITAVATQAGPGSEQWKVLDMKLPGQFFFVNLLPNLYAD